MNTLNAIKSQVQALYQTHPNIHMSVAVPGGKVHLKNHPVTITAIYPNIFRVEDRTGDTPAAHIVQYVELMTGHVHISELTQSPPYGSEP